MLTAEIRYHFNAADLEDLKQAAALHLQNIAPSQRLELLARFCGFATLAGFRASLVASGEEESTLDLDPERAAAFAAERGLTFDALEMHQTLASVNRPGFPRGFFVQSLSGFFKGFHLLVECLLHFLRRPMTDRTV